MKLTEKKTSDITAFFLWQWQEIWSDYIIKYPSPQRKKKKIKKHCSRKLFLIKTKNYNINWDRVEAGGSVKGTTQ